MKKDVSIMKGSTKAGITGIPGVTRDPFLSLLSLLRTGSQDGPSRVLRDHFPLPSSPRDSLGDRWEIGGGFAPKKCLISDTIL